jgi:hypothetical protein
MVNDFGFSQARPASSCWIDRLGLCHLDRVAYAFDLCHHFLKCSQCYGLIPVSHGTLGMGMELDNQAVRPGGNSGEGQWNHKIPTASCMAEVNDDRKMTFSAQYWNRRDIQRVPRAGFKGADADTGVTRSPGHSRRNVFNDTLSNDLFCETSNDVLLKTKTRRWNSIQRRVIQLSKLGEGLGRQNRSAREPDGGVAPPPPVLRTQCQF